MQLCFCSFTIVLEEFLVFVTGSIHPRHHSIQVQFIDDDDIGQGAITAHTCSKIIMFPQCVFSTYELFSSALNSVIGGNTFNTVEQLNFGSFFVTVFCFCYCLFFINCPIFHMY